jgi:hypothetical protein
MDNFSTVSTDISSQIGALELGGAWERHNDDALEAAGASMALAPTMQGAGCFSTFRCIGDGALEAAGASMHPVQATQVRAGCGVPVTWLRCATDDRALEATGANVAIGPSVGACRPPPTLLRCVSDSALERAADTAMSDQPPLPTAYPGPRCF